MTDALDEQAPLIVLLGDGDMAVDFLPDQNGSLPDREALDELDELGYELRPPATLGGDLNVVADLVFGGVIKAALDLGLDHAVRALKRSRAQREQAPEQVRQRVSQAVARARTDAQDVVVQEPVRAGDGWEVRFTVDGVAGKALVEGNGAVVVLDFSPGGGIEPS